MEGFNKKNGTDIVRVPFKGGGDAVTSMLNGTTQIAIFGIGNLISFIKAGQDRRARDRRRHSARRWRRTFRPSRRSATASTSRATFFGVYAPAGTPKPIVDKLYKVDRRGRHRSRISSRNS